MKPKRSKATVIEVYDNGSRAAVSFRNPITGSKRVEVIQLHGMTPAFELGQRGWVKYQQTMAGTLWTFEPFKKSAEDRHMESLVAALTGFDPTLDD